MTRLLFVLITLAQFGCNDTSQKGDGLETVKSDSTSIEYFIRQVRQQTLLYLDTMFSNDSKKFVRFHSKLDSSTYQTLQNWIFHNEKKIQPDDMEVLNQLINSNVDSFLLVRYDTILTAGTSNVEKITQVHFNGFSFNSDTTKIATVVGVFFGDEGERITGWKEFLIFNRQGTNFTIAQRSIVTEY